MRNGIFIYDNIDHAHQRGIARYFQQVAAGLSHSFAHRITMCSPRPWTDDAVRWLDSSNHPIWQLLWGREGVADRLAKRVRPALVYCPYYGVTTVSAPHIYTAYDMIHELSPGHRDVRFSARKRRCLESAAAILTISHSTARDIGAVYPHVDPARVFVTHLGVDPSFLAPRPPCPAHCDRPFFFFIGYRSSYKNFHRLLEAFAKSGLAKDFDLRVISPAGHGFDRAEAELIQRYGLANRVCLLIGPDDETVRAHYAWSWALVYPSEREGFGLPLLEAMASRTLVATSNTSSMPEVGGQAALYFDPRSADSIADCLTRLAGVSGDERAARIRLGVERASGFTWERCQRATVEVFRRVLG